MIVFFIFSNCLVLIAQNQSFGDEWIEFDKEYLKIEINADGIYRLSIDEIKKAGLSEINSPVIYRHGKPIYIFKSPGFNEGKSDAYIEFYAEKNKGVLDALMYRPNVRTNPFHSLFSDISAYFLVNDSSIPFSSIEISTDKANTKSHFTEKLIYAPNSQYSYNNLIGLLPVLQQSYYEPGEGWTGNFISADTSAQYKFNLTGLDTSVDSKIKIKFGINGRSRVLHQIKLKVNNDVEKDFRVEPFGMYNDSVLINMPSNPTLTITLSSNQKMEFDWYSPTYFEISYPRTFDNLSYPKAIGLIKDDLNKQHFEIKNPNAFVYEISDIYRAKKISYSQGQNAIISDQAIQLFVNDKINKPLKINKLKFKQYNNNSDYLIITHNSLLESANQWANYRRSPEGGGFNVEIAIVEDLYNRFFYGERNPLSLKRAIGTLLKNSDRKHLFLIGRPVTFPDVLKNGSDLVPSMGYPGSDVLLSAGLFGEDSDVEGVATGRVNVTKNSEVHQYLEKVKEFEKLPPAEWRKNILHLSGGENPFEMVILKNLLKEIEPKATEKSLFKSNINEFNKKSDSPIEEINISTEVNQGAGLMTFVGHGSPTIIDLNFGFASDPKRQYNNRGKYPLMFFNGCGVGNIFYRYDPLSTNWILTPNKGAVAVFANSFWSYYNSTRLYLQTFYETLYTDPNAIALSIGEIHQVINRKLASKKEDPYIMADMHQVVLQGDPAIKIFPTEKPDYYIKNQQVFLKAISETGNIQEGDSVRVGVFAGNLGRYMFNKIIKSHIKVQYFNRNDFSKTFEHAPIANQDTLFVTVPGQFIKKIEVSLNYQNSNEEYIQENNVAVLNINTEADWTNIAKLNTYPENALPDKTNPILEVWFDDRKIKNLQAVAKNTKVKLLLRDERNLKSESGNSLFNVFIKSCENCQYLPINTEKYPLKSVENNKIELLIDDWDLNPGTYSLLVQGRDMSGNTTGIPYEISFVVLKNNSNSKFFVSPNPTESISVALIEVFDVENPKNGVLSVYNAAGKKLFDQSYEPRVGPNAVNLPIREMHGSGLYLIKNTLTKADGSTETEEFKLVIR